MAAYQSTRDQAYLDQATRWGTERHWGPGIATEGPNVLTCPQVYLEIYFANANRSCIEPTIEWLDSGRKNTPSGAKYWYFSELRYVDSLYVGAPTLAMLTKATGDLKYINWMNAFFWDVHRELFDRDIGLFYRDKGFIGQRDRNGRRILWSRGNGWAFASLPRILTYLPADDPSRPGYVALLQQMAAAIVERQQPDGFWRANLDDPEEFPTPETSGDGILLLWFGLGHSQRRAGSRRLPPQRNEGLEGSGGNRQSRGQGAMGQNVGDRPEAVKKSDTREYVTGTFLLAGSEMLHLARGDGPEVNDQEYLEMTGLNVMLAHDFYPEGHQGGVGIIQNGQRVATNGDLRLEPTPGQWQPTPAVGPRRSTAPPRRSASTWPIPDESQEPRGSTRSPIPT
jgi:unsaturated rhamnogalacturonyl hydrolase